MVPQPQAKSDEERAEEELNALEEAEEQAAHQADRPDLDAAPDDGPDPDPDQAASVEPDVAEEEMADPVSKDLDDDFFSGSETKASAFDAEESEAAGPQMSEGDPLSELGPEEADDEETPDAQFEDAINGGASRLAVVGLDDPEQDDLQEEFREVFEEFQLGFYGDQCVRKYGGSDDVDPIWGLLGSMLLCSVIVVSMRPDGDELVTSAKQRLGNGKAQT